MYVTRNFQLQDAVSGVRVIVCGPSEPEEEEFPPPPPDISGLHIGEYLKTYVNPYTVQYIMVKMLQI